MKTRSSIAALMALICLAHPFGWLASDQPSHNPTSAYIYDSWTTDDGLPQNSVTSIVQTRDGYLWLGTFGGLARFDGIKLTVYEIGKTEGLKSNRIRAICEDRRGALWVGTEVGGLTRHFNGEFTTYTRENGLPSDNVATIFEDRSGTLWLGSSEGLTKFEDGRFTTHTTKDGLFSNAVTAIIEDREGRLWMCAGGRLVQFDAGVFTTYSSQEGFPSGGVLSVCAARDGSLWVGTHGGLVRFSDGVFTTYTRDQGLSSNVVKHIMEDRTGNIWVGTEKGLNLIAAGMSTAYILEGALSDSSIRDLAEDREGNIWVGTDTTGIYRLKAGKLYVYAKEQGLPNEVVVPITEDAEGSLWIGLNCGGLVRFRDGKFTPYILKGGLSIDCVWSLCAAQDGTLWIGTWGSGLTRLKDGNFFTYTTLNSGLSNNVVLAIYQDRQGTLWVGTNAGLNRLRDGEFTVYRRAEGLVSDDVRFITEDGEGALWIGATGGASRFKDGVFTNYTVAEGLSHNFVRAIHVDEDQAVWLGTYSGGLNRFKDGRFTHYRRADGLFDDVVSRILKDDQGNFWMTGNRGIYRVSRRQLNDFAEGKINSITSLSYGVADGMKSQECNGGGQPAGWRTRDGRLWFPTIRGVVMIDPKHLNENEMPPPVVIERVLANKKPVDHRGKIEVPPGRGDLEIEYTGLSFVAPEKVRFKYKLDGYDDDWIEAGTRRVAYYTNIPPGEYRFQVIASNNDGVWNIEGAALEVRVIPPFWRTWWFLALATLLVVGLAILIYERRVSQLKKAHAAQEAFSRQLIESQERERKRIAAELHDSLGQSIAIIKNRAALSLSQRENHQRALDQLEEISTAASHALDEVKEIVYNLRPYQLDRLGLTKAIKSMLKKAFNSNGIRSHFEIDLIDRAFSKEDEINLYRIVQESLNNIIKHAEATEVKVAIKKHEREVEIRIEDNGKGFMPENPGTGGSPARGFGLTGIAERARMLGGTSMIHSAPGKGTRIKIRLKLKEVRDGN